MSLTNDDITWYSSIYDVVEIIDSCGDFSNAPLLGTQGGINYNPNLGRHQLGFSMKDKPNNTLLEDLFFYQGKDSQGLKARMVRDRHNVHRKRKSELELKNCIALEPYTSWMEKRAKEFKMPYAYERPMSLVMVKSPTIKGIEELQEASDKMKQERDDWEDKFDTSHLEKVELQKQLKEKCDLIELLGQCAVKRSRDQEDLFFSNSSSSTHLPTSGV
ncbi:uncharacterized protein LOC127094376 [Lathyrus oleraceus]|uniref:uncharacterized protein LOC127094376 n=1 Tax=Pisum sativum TaxID=3888 RepID=UPI0021D305CA|nr:uncharacterized protein LOC127094376 [Pisum sativum]